MLQALFATSALPCSDTEVDVRAVRSRRVRLRARADRAGPRESDPEPLLGSSARRRDPGDTLAPAPLGRVRIREAIVRKNRDADRLDEPARPRPPDVPLVRIDWVRTTDPGLRIRARGRDAAALRGRALTRASVSVGLEGLIFSVPTAPGESALESLSRLAERLAPRYEVVIALVGETAELRVVACARGSCHRAPPADCLAQSPGGPRPAPPADERPCLRPD